MSARTRARVGFEPGSDAESAWHYAVAGVVSHAAGSVCAVCGLKRMGHAPETEWLGYSRHDWSPVPATPDMIARANELTVTAYRLRRVACGHKFPSAACRRGECVHVSGHCEHCL